MRTKRDEKIIGNLLDQLERAFERIHALERQLRPKPKRKKRKHKN